MFAGFSPLSLAHDNKVLLATNVTGNWKQRQHWHYWAVLDFKEVTKLIPNMFIWIFIIIIELETQNQKILVENLKTSKNASSDLWGFLKPKLENLSRPQGTVSRQKEASGFTWSGPLDRKKTVGVKAEGLWTMVFVCWCFSLVHLLYEPIAVVAGSGLVEHF